MYRSCCRAANAYDPALAIRYAFGQIQSASSTRKTKLTRPSGAISRPNATGTQARGRKPAFNRLYSTRTRPATDNEEEWGEIDEMEKQSQRLSLYESMLGSENRSTQRDETPAGRGDGDTEAATQKDATSDPLHWRKHMADLTQRARDIARDENLDQETGKRLLEYEAENIHPREPEESSNLPIPWVMSRDLRQTLSPTEALDSEIQRFADYMKLSHAEVAARKAIMHILYAVVRQAMGDGIKAWIYGSQRHGTAMPFSDIDIGVNDPLIKPGETLEKRMDAVYHRMNERRDFICVVSRGGKYPIVTAQHKDSGIDVQIVVAEQYSKQSAIVKSYLKSIPNMQGLYAVVRTMFGMRGLIDPFIGGISSYGTFMMLAASLTRRGLPPDTHSSPGTQLLHFLSFWSTFDTTKRGLCLSTSTPFLTTKPFTKPLEEDLPTDWRTLFAAAKARNAKARASQYRVARLRPMQPYLLCLQDPAQHGNDLGARCHAIKHITRTIKALDKLMRYRFDRRAHLFRRHDTASFLLPLVGRCHEVYAERRRRVEAFGLEAEEKTRKHHNSRMTRRVQGKGRGGGGWEAAAVPRGEGCDYDNSYSLFNTDAV